MQHCAPVHYSARGEIEKLRYTSASSFQFFTLANPSPDLTHLVHAPRHAHAPTHLMTEKSAMGFDLEATWRRGVASAVLSRKAAAACGTKRAERM